MSGSHMAVANIMNQGCSQCTTAVATSFCCCYRTETLLCQACILTHYAKGPGRIHQILPLQAFGPHKAQGYIERLQRRTEAMETGKAALLSNLEAMDRCIADVTQKINEVIQVIWYYGQTTVAELTGEKLKLEETIQRSIAEAERSLYDDTPSLQTPLSGLLREYEEFKSNSLQLFSYSINPQELPTPLSSLFTYSLSTNPTITEKLVRLNGNSLLILDVATGMKRKFLLSVPVSNKYRYCLVSPTTLIAVGGREAISVNLDYANVVNLPPPNAEHTQPGVIAAKQEAYVFGGLCPNCEKLSRDMVWNNLPKMSKARGAFIPCLYEKEIYIASPESQDIEIFTLNTASFRVFSIPFPALTNSSISLFVGGVFTIISGSRQIAELVGTESSFRIHPLTVRVIYNVAPSHPPVVIGKKAYWFSAFTEDLTTYDSDTKTLKEEHIS